MGWLGNNSSGSTSIQYGVTRDKVLQIDGVLSDGTEASFSELTSDEFKAKRKEKTKKEKFIRLFTGNSRSKPYSKKFFLSFQKRVSTGETQAMQLMSC